jgi:hypothetical protein
VGGKPEAMMGRRQVDQAALFYEFSLERHVPATHLLRSIDRCRRCLDDAPMRRLAPIAVDATRATMNENRLIIVRPL